MILSQRPAYLKLSGLKPVKKRAAVAQPRATDRSSPATYADARNRCLQRRDARGVNGGGDTPDPKWDGGGPVQSSRWQALSPSCPA
jgi:hypothetical protein